MAKNTDSRNTETTMPRQPSIGHWIVILLLILACNVALLVAYFYDGQHASETAASDKPPSHPSAAEPRQPNGSDTALVAATPDSSMKDQSCAPGQFVTGIDRNGLIVCGSVAASPAEMTAALENDCYGHGFVRDGFCRCDKGWTGAYCEKRAIPRPKDAPPDNDSDNVPAPIDCDDNDDLVYPGAPDVVDGKDNDCDGETDEGY